MPSKRHLKTMLKHVPLQGNLSLLNLKAILMKSVLVFNSSFRSAQYQQPSQESSGTWGEERNQPRVLVQWLERRRSGREGQTNMPTSGLQSLLH